MKIVCFKNRIPDIPQSKFHENVLQSSKTPEVFSEFINIKKINNENFDANYLTRKRFNSVESFEIPGVGKGIFFELNNGHKIAIIQRAGIFSISTGVNTNPEEKLKAHILEHIIYDSRNKIGKEEFAQKLDSAGAKRKAYTNHSNTIYSIEYPFDDKNKIKEFITAQKKLLNISDETISSALNKTKVVLKNEYALTNDYKDRVSSDSLSDLQTVNKALSMIYDTKADPLLLKPVLNNSEQNGIENITFHEIKDFYNKYYKPQNMFTLIFTPTSLKDIEKFVIDTFIDDSCKSNDAAKRIHPKISNPIRGDFISQDTNDVSVHFIAGNNTSAGDNMIQKIVGYYLADNSYNFQELNLKEYNSDNKVLSFFAQAQKGEEEETLKKLYADLYKLVNNSDFQNKLEIYKSKARNEFSIISEHPSMLEELIFKSDFSNNPKLFEQQSRALDNINSDDIKKYLKEYIDFQKACVIVNHKSDRNTKPVSFGSSIDRIDTSEVKEFQCENNMSLTIDTSKNVKRSAYRINLRSYDAQYTNTAVTKALELIVQDNLHKVFKNEAISDYSVLFSNNNLTVSASSLPQDTEKLIKGINSAIIKTFPADTDLKRFQAKTILVMPKTKFEPQKEELIELIQKDFELFAPKFNKILICPHSQNTEHIFERTDSNNSLISISYKFSGCENSKKDITVSLINNLLGNMLTSKLETGLKESNNLYNAGSNYNTQGCIGSFSVGCQFMNDNNPYQVRDIINVINKDISELKEVSVEDELLQNAKNILKGTINQLMNSASGRAEVHSSLNVDKLNSFYQVIDEITSEDIKNCANKIFAGSKTYYLKSKQEIFESNKEYFKN